MSTLKEVTKQLNTVAALRAKRAVYRQKFDEADKAVRDAEDTLLNAMLDAKTDQLKHSKGGMVFVTRSTVPQADDWAAIDAFILKKKALDLLQRRLSVTAWRERLDSDILVPGTSAFEVVKLGTRGLG